MNCLDKGGKKLPGIVASAILLLLIGLPLLSIAGERSEALFSEISALDTTFRHVLSELDRSARLSEEVSREVQSLKAQGAIGVLAQLRLQSLLSRLREILLDRRELKKLERNLELEREKKALLLYDLMGEEIDSLAREAEILLRRGEGQRAAQAYQTLLAEMQKREGLRKPSLFHIGALPEIDLPGLEGASPSEAREVAILLRNDAETLEKKRVEMEEERRLLREELKTKKMLSRLQGYPRGIETEPIRRQTPGLEERLSALDQAIDRYARRIQNLFATSDRMLASAKRQEEQFK